MNSRPLLHILIVICFFLISSCTNKKNSSESPIKKDSTSYYFQKGKSSEAIQEKIVHFNKALQSINSIEDSFMLDILDNKIYYHNRLKEYDSSLHFADRLIKTAQTQNDSAFIATGYYRKAFIFKYLNQYEKVFENTFKARQIYLRIGDSVAAGNRSSEMAIAQSQMTDFNGAQISATEALDYVKPDDSSSISSAYNTIATSYRQQGFYQDAITEWKNAVNYATTLRDSLSNLNNIALALRDQKKYEEALEFFKNIVEKSGQVEIKSQARYLDNLAYTKWLKDSTADIKTDLIKAKQMRLKKNDKNGLLASYDHLSEYYKQRDGEKSKLYADSLFATAKNLGSKSARLNALQKLIDLSPPEKIRELSARYITLNDS